MPLMPLHASEGILHKTNIKYFYFKLFKDSIVVSTEKKNPPPRRSNKRDLEKRHTTKTNKSKNCFYFSIFPFLSTSFKNCSLYPI